MAGGSPAPVSADASLFDVMGSLSRTAVRSPRCTTSLTLPIAPGTGLSAGQAITFTSFSLSCVPMAIERLATITG